jgi:hypothetical protein
MNRPIRSLVVLLTFGAIAALALLPAGHVGQNQQGLFASLVGPSAALARIRILRISDTFGSSIFTFPAFTASPELDARGREVVVRGHITCDPGDLFRIRVTVSQLATDELDGAVGEGTTQGFCTGEIFQAWVAKAKAHASTVFDEEGAWKVCAVAITQGKGPINDAFQWCKDFPLLEEEE